MTHDPAPLLEWEVPVARWHTWSRSSAGDAPPLPPGLDPGLKRRLSPLAKIALGAAYDCAGGQSQVRLVYASRHGELARTTQMLDALNTAEEISPMAFSTSVLNATAGIYSIAQADRTGSTAVSAGPETLGQGLLEASLLWLHEPGPPVLFLYADEPPPAVYGSVAHETDEARVIALLLNDNSAYTLRCTRSSACARRDAAPQHRRFEECLKTMKATQWHGARDSWGWRIRPTASDPST